MKSAQRNSFQQLLIPEIVNIGPRGRYAYGEIRVKWRNDDIPSFKNHSIKGPISSIKHKTNSFKMAILK